MTTLRRGASMKNGGENSCAHENYAATLRCGFVREIRSSLAEDMSCRQHGIE